MDDDSFFLGTRGLRINARIFGVLDDFLMSASFYARLLACSLDVNHQCELFCGGYNIWLVKSLHRLVVRLFLQRGALASEIAAYVSR